MVLHMDCLLVFPVADLREVILDDVGLRPRPAWPIGKVFDEPGYGEFLQGFGQLANTSDKESAKWDGRAQHVPASSIRLPSQFTTYFPGATARCLRRRYFGSVTTPLAFAELKFKIRHPNPDMLLTAMDLAAVIAKMPLRMRDSRIVEPARNFGPLFAEYLRRNSTRNDFAGATPEWLISPGRPVCVITVSRQSQIGFDAKGHAPPSVLNGMHFTTISGMDCWILNGEVVPRPRCTELHLTRIHAERTALEAVWRTFALRLPQRDRDRVTPDDVKLKHYVTNALQYLDSVPRRGKRSGKVSSGRDTRLLQKAIRSNLGLHEAQWRALFDSLRLLLRNRDAEAMFERYASATYGVHFEKGAITVMGDHLQASGASTIVSKSVVQDAFNRLAGDDEAELRRALSAIAEAVQKENNPEANQIVEGLIEECAGAKRPGVVKAIWNALKEAAPVVASMTTAAKAITTTFS